MSPAAAGPLLYVSDIGAEDVDVFSYPGGKQVGKLTGFSEPAGLCTDRKGDVFVVDSGSDRILEYAHGGTSPIATLRAGRPSGVRSIRKAVISRRPTFRRAPTGSDRS